MSRVLWRTLVLLALLLVPAPAAAAARFGEVGGHLSIGTTTRVTHIRIYRNASKRVFPLFIIDVGTAGSGLSMVAGLDYPVAPSLRAGLDLGYDLLGSQTFQRGSLFGAVDYSAFEVTAFLHWLPQQGLVRRVSLGPALVNAHGVLSVTGGGAGFSDLAVHETAGAVAAQITLMKAKPAPVKLGLDLGGRRAFLAGKDWTLLSVRVTVHY